MYMYLELFACRCVLCVYIAVQMLSCMCVVSRSVAISVESRGTESQRKVCLQDHSNAQSRRSHQWKVSPKQHLSMSACIYSTV